MLLQAIRKPARNHKIFQYNKNKFKEKGGKKERRKQTFPQRIHAVPKMVFYFFICLSSLLPNCLLHTPNPSRMCFTRSSMSTFCSMTCMLGALPRAIYLYFYYILPSIVQKDLPPESHNLISLYWSETAGFPKLVFSVDTRSSFWVTESSSKTSTPCQTVTSTKNWRQSTTTLNS